MAFEYLNFRGSSKKDGKKLHKEEVLFHSLHRYY
jgi:hypothetical protein